MGGGGQEGGRQKGCDTECEQRRMGEKKGVSAASAVWLHQEILTSGGKQFLGHLVETSFHVGKLLTFQSGNISHAWHPGLSTEPTQTPYCPSPSYWLPPKAKFLASMVPI